MRKFLKMLPLLVLMVLAKNVMGQPLSGTYSIGASGIVSGEVVNYATLSAAVTALNTNGVGGPCTFYFSESKTYTEAADIGIGYTGGSASNTVTFKPYTGIACTISFTSNATRASGIDGSLIIGASDITTAPPTTLISTNYLIIDGSNTIGGVTKDLTISNTGVTAQKSLIRIFGNSDNITVKNCILYSSSTSTSTNAAINITNYFSNPTNYNPDNIVIQNNTITANSGTASAGIHSANSGSPTVGANSLTIRDNEIYANLRGAFISYTNGGDIYNNSISLVSTGTTGNVTAYGITIQTNFTTGTFNIYNNNLINLTTNTTSAAGASNGIIGIDNQCVTPKIVNIYNNVIRGFATAGAANNARIYGIRNTSTSTTTIYNNSIYLPELNNMTTPNNIGGIAFATAATTEASPSAAASCIVKNNTIFIDESTMKVWAIRRVGNTGTFTSDNNNVYINTTNASGYIGYFNTADAQTLANWQTASSQDANSFNLNPNFTSATDLTPTLGGYFPGTNTLYSTTDINGVTRSTTKPHIGAYESTAKHWLGITNDWSTASNWRDNILPTSGDNVIIGYGSTNTSLPGNTTITNIGLQTGTALGIGSNTFTINGTVTGTGTLTGSSSSNLVIGGAAGTLNFTSGSRTLKDLTLNAGATATLGTALDITAGATPGVLTVASGATLTTGNNLTLKSDNSGTARIGNSAGTISGNITQERYFAGGAATGTPPTPGVRGFRFIAHPFNSNPLLNTLVAGGLSITGDGGATNGFTNNPNPGATNSPSAFSYNPAATGAGTGSPDLGWTAYTNANTETWNKMQGIRVLFRGTNTQGLDGNNVYAVNPLTLSLTGAVNTGAQNFALPATTNVTDPKWSLVGNPYPSQIDVQTLLRNKYNTPTPAAGNIGAAAYVFNPTKSGTLRGGYDMIDISAAGSYILPTCGVVLVQNTIATTHNIPFAETDKSTGTPTLNFRTTSTNNALVLTMKDANGVELDNTYIRLNNNAANTFENRDGGKMLNDYSIYTLTPDNTLLAIDSRPEPIVESIIPMGVKSATAQSFVLKATELALPIRIEAYLKDKFLNVATPLSLGTEYSFSVDPSNAATLGNNRFEIVMRNNNALPATFLNVTAAQKNAGIEVSWTTANETNMSNYEVEESTDGNNFSKATSVAANNTTTNIYNWLDASIINGDNYYRIKAIEKNGTAKYSNVVKVKIGGKGAGFTVYPNPVKGGVVSLQMSNVEKGIYTVKIFNNIGQELAAKAINHNGGSATQTIDLGKGIASGTYNMQITNGTKTVITKTVIVE